MSRLIGYNLVRHALGGNVPKCSQMFLKSSLLLVNRMGTKGQQRTETQNERGQQMFNEIKYACLRSRETLVQDAAGAAALVVMLIAALYLPGTF
ncbi:MAG TPA: hypothetical protein ENJ91_11730 [Rhodobacteraceae bacterium]|nr:hypothetical protein [Paracoccaceae bacterium]